MPPVVEANGSAARTAYESKDRQLKSTVFSRLPMHGDLLLPLVHNAVP